MRVGPAPGTRLTLAVKVKYGSGGKPRGFFSSIFRGVVVLALAGLLVFTAVFIYYYFQYEKVVDDRLAAGPIFNSVAQIYAAPHEIRTGQHLTAGYIAQQLRTAGYNSNPELKVRAEGRQHPDQTGKTVVPLDRWRDDQYAGQYRSVDHGRERRGAAFV